MLENIPSPTTNLIINFRITRRRKIENIGGTVSKNTRAIVRRVLLQSPGFLSNDIEPN